MEDKSTEIKEWDAKFQKQQPVLGGIFCQEVIVSDQRTIGKGADWQSPIRVVTQIFTKDGECLAINDQCGNFGIEDLLAYADFERHSETDRDVTLRNFIQNRISIYR